MSGLFGALEIGKRALFAGQAGLQVTGHNIANANTPGYSRRIVTQVPAPGVRLPQGILGSGTDIERVARARDEHVEARLLQARADLGRASAQARNLGELETLIGDLDGESLSSALGAFFDSWQELSLEPESSPARQSVIVAGAAVAGRLNALSNGLTEMRSRLMARLPAEVDAVNASVARIAELSRRVGQAEADGIEASDLRDLRDREVALLAERIDVNVTEAPNGSFLVRVGGVVVADGERALRVSLGAASEEGVATMGADADASTSGALRLSVEGVELSPTGGSLASTLEAARTALPGYLANLDEIAEGLASSVNAIHEAGYGLDGGSGVAFFETDAEGADLAGADMSSPGAAARIRIASAIIADPRRVAASSDGSAGNNASARAIADLDRSPTQRGGTATIADLALGFSLRVASDTAQASFLEDAGTGIVESLENRRDAVSGVSLDEEALNLVKYQQAYEAAARVISVTNEMLDTLLREL
jgi:flagellar hook-associated protein 1